MKTLGWQVVNAIALLGAITVNVARAQNTTESVPQVDVPTAIAAWPTVTNEAFVKQVLEMQSQQSQWDPAVVKQFREAMGQEAARRLRGADPSATGDIKYLPRLTEWATSQLTPEELRAAQQVIESQLQNKSDASIAELKAAVQAMGTVKGTLATRSRMVHGWMQGRDLTPLSLDDLSWCARTMSAIRGRGNRGLHVRWTGSIQAPRDGNYVFGACPSQMVMDYTYGMSKTQ